MGRENISLSWKKIHNWTVLDMQYKQKGINPKTGRSTGRLIHLQCDCGFETYGDIALLQRGSSRQCRSCTSTSSLQLYENIPIPYYARLKKEALKRKLNFNIELSHLHQQWESQQGICKLSGLSLQFPPGSVFGRANKKGSEEAQTASLDRVDSTRGYEPDNIQWIHKAINQMKSNRTDREFIKWCNLISTYNKEK